ncbi:substrate-binding periplasmic protein [Pigmentibacter ruber]|uniref:substrate-binding periplasmic protein n=1 Tax=Pigmentibacter ruber TaxID=2683196 RepID=UPI00131CE108|nr:ABC transporter substrate-binding protein [Pigmentibacter ruber]BFD30589.1 ABC transporter substrate-binding protein [Pigmentibacter ruber]
MYRKINYIFTILALIFLQYKSFSFDEIKIYTEEKPPNNFEGPNNKVTGISTEIVEEIFKNAHINYSIEILPWARALDTASKNKDIGLYSLARTPDRENSFYWIGPLIKNDWSFFTRKNSKIKIHKLDDAKKYLVGVYKQSALSNYLLENGFKADKNLDFVNEEKYNPTKLERNRIDIWATGLLVGLFHAKEHKTTFVPIYTIKEVGLYLAFNKSTDKNLISTLEKSFDKIKNSEKIKSIQKKYGYKK